MSRMDFKNTFGSTASGQGIDLQRQDLFKFTIDLPAPLNIKWADEVEFAVETFPFPERTVETYEVKYMQQTNHQIGADTATSAVDITIRYAFNTRVAEALEKWFWLIRNPLTGGVGLTSQVKTKGYFRWLVPNQSRQNADISGSPVTTQNTLKDGLQYQLEGCMIKGLKFSDASMTGSEKVDLTFSLQIDRYYPVDIDNMIVPV